MERSTQNTVFCTESNRHRRQPAEPMATNPLDLILQLQKVSCVSATRDSVNVRANGESAAH